MHLLCPNCKERLIVKNRQKVFIKFHCPKYSCIENKFDVTACNIVFCPDFKLNLYIYHNNKNYCIHNYYNYKKFILYLEDFPYVEPLMEINRFLPTNIIKNFNFIDFYKIIDKVEKLLVFK